MDIVLSFTSSASLAPSGFISDVQYAASMLDTLITDNITLALSVDWDTSGSVLGEASFNATNYVSYSQLVSALQTHASAAVGLGLASGSIALESVLNMPTTDPTNGRGVWLSGAQAEALGLAPSSNTTALAGSATFGTGGAALNFSTTDLSVPGEITFLGVALHELVHALGRAGWGDGSVYSLMDLLRYHAPGVLEESGNSLSGTSPSAYFSIDGGKTNLADFSTTSDFYDWSPTVPNDSFDAYANYGAANTISAVDQTLLSALGFDVSATCFTPGTRIRTPEGETPVEALRTGDLVQTRLRGARKVKWVGKREYDGRFVGDNHLILPVTIRAGALGPSAPARDLTVSPGHGICLHGALVPAWRLVNGVSITQAARVDSITYYHVELAAHDLLLAENCLCESYLDIGDRAQFHNAAEYAALYPGEAAPALPCLPRLESGFALAAAQAEVNARAGFPLMTEVAGGLRGFIDTAGPERVTGWAQCEAAPEAPVALDILAGGAPVAQVLANAYRADLRRAGLGSGCHGFELLLPAGAERPITIRRALDGALLPFTEAALAA
ncbi:MAG: NF038122 family metalloprotease [Acidocella sp.]|nr:NF038122 family metalloprotease [Acidocella sp.]